MIIPSGVSVAGSAVTLAAIPPGRCSVVITNAGGVTLYVGAGTSAPGTAPSLTGNGAPVPAGAVVSLAQFSSSSPAELWGSPPGAPSLPVFSYQLPHEGKCLMLGLVSVEARDRQAAELAESFRPYIQAGHAADSPSNEMVPRQVRPDSRPGVMGAGPMAAGVRDQRAGVQRIDLDAVTMVSADRPGPGAA